MYGRGRMSYTGRGWRLRGGHAPAFPGAILVAGVVVFALAVGSLHYFPFFLFWWVVPFFVVPAVVFSAGRIAGYMDDRLRRPVERERKEKELLVALARRGELTAAGAALETSLSVAEADRMLSALARDGHVEVRAREGRLGYALWDHDRKELAN